MIQKKNSQTSNEVEKNNKFIKIIHFLRNDEGEVICYRKGYDDFKTYLIERYIKPDHITSFTSVVNKEIDLRNTENSNYSYKKMKVFQLELSNGSEYLLPGSEFEKIEEIVNNG